MESSEQVFLLLKDAGVGEAKTRGARMIDRATSLSDLVSQYRDHLVEYQWDEAQRCLARISTLVVSMNCE
jgi:hypothetical protein